MINSGNTDPHLPADISQWVDAHLKQHSLPPMEQVALVTDRPWSRVWKLTTGTRQLYCKAVAPFMNAELALTAQLHRSHPDLIPEPLAMDSEKGWLLARDGGPLMRTFFESTPRPEPWFRILADYARLQIDWMEHSISLRSLGIPDRSTASLANQVLPLIDLALSIEVEDEEDRLGMEHKPLLEELLREWAVFAESLYPGDLSDTLNHGDLHDGNIAWREGQGRIFDWGDASVSHPFMSMRTVLLTLERRFGLKDGDPGLYPYIQAYLAPWKAQLPEVDIDALFAESRKAWPLVSLLSWHHAIQNRRDERSQSYDYAIPSLFREFLRAHGIDD